MTILLMILTLVAAEEPAVGPADYLDRYFATFPSRATAAGRHDLDWELEDLTPQRRAEWLAFNREPPGRSRRPSPTRTCRGTTGSTPSSCCATPSSSS